MEENFGKHTIEARHYTETPNGIRCLICPNECLIKEGRISDCHNHIVKQGKLYSIAYGNPCAIHVDPIEKKPLYHFLPESRAYSIATAGCNLSCLCCQNWSISQIGPRDTENYDLMPERVVEECIKNDCLSIAYTYTEPITFFEYTYDTAKIARAKGIKNVLITAGYINKKPLRELCKFIDAVNIDLKSFSNDIYMKLNGATLQPVLDAIKILKEEGVWMEITNLIIPDWTDDLSMINKMCKWLYKNGLENVPLHFSRFHPMYKLSNTPSTPIDTVHKARDIAVDAGLKYVYTGNVPTSKSSHTYCPSCQKLVVERDGYRIKKNLIVNGKCSFCNELIHGVWE